MYNWDYDKLFASGNIVGLKNTGINRVFAHEVFTQEDYDNYVLSYVVDWNDYKNESLSCGKFQIEYIIRLDTHGNIIEKLFDRERDMIEDNPMPELKPGMFGKVMWWYSDDMPEGDMYDTDLFVVGNVDNVVYRNGRYDDIKDFDCDMQNAIVKSAIVEIYKDANCFNSCYGCEVTWRDSRYQVWLDKQEG